MAPKKPTATKHKEEEGDENTEAPLCTVSLSTVEAIFGRLLAAFTTTFTACMDRTTTAIDEKLSVRLDVNGKDILDINHRLDLVEKANRELVAENFNLKASIKELHASVLKLNNSLDEMNQYSRSDNILIHGVPYSSDGSQETDIGGVVVTTLNNNIMGINLLGADISSAHRIGRPNTAAPGQSSKPQPIVVRFVRRAMRNTLLYKRKELKGKRLVITEQLTQPRSQLLKKVKRLGHG